jgi:exosortase B
MTLTLNNDLTRSREPAKLELILLSLAMLYLYAPTYALLDRTVWTAVGQGHGPVMLALTLWLIWKRGPEFLALPDSNQLLAGSVALVSGIGFYVLGHSQDILFLDVLSQTLILTALMLFYRGWAGLRLMWFPLVFSFTIVPIPGSIVDVITGPMKTAVSVVSERLMYAMGFPIGRSGVTLTIGPYQLLVADACAGLNSIFALEAIGIFYISVVQHRQGLRNVILALSVIPISFTSNVIRVIALTLITFYFGDQVGQGFVHNFAGILLFMMATALLILFDGLLGLFFAEPTKV